MALERSQDGGDFWSQYPAEGAQYGGGGDPAQVQTIGGTQPGDWRTMQPAVTAGQGIDPNAPTGQTTGQPAPAQSGADVTEQVKALVGNDYSPAHLAQILPQLKALGVEVQNQDRGDLRPRFRLPNGEQWDFGPGGWINSGHGIQPGFGAGGPGVGGGTLGQIGQSADSRNEFLRNTPGYDFQFKEGQRAVMSAGAAMGNLLSGRTLKALTQWGQGLAGTDYGNEVDRYMRAAQQGQNAVTSSGS